MNTLSSVQYPYGYDDSHAIDVNYQHTTGLAEPTERKTCEIHFQHYN